MPGVRPKVWGDRGKKSNSDSATNTHVFSSSLSLIDINCFNSIFLHHHAQSSPFLDDIRTSSPPTAPPQHTHVWGLLPRTLRVPAGEDGRPGQVFSTSLARPPANERGTSDSVMPSGRDVQEAEMGPELERAESSLP